MYAVSIFGGNDCILEVYKNGIPIVKFTEQRSSQAGVTAGRPLGYDRGYIMGYANLGLQIPST